MIIDSKGKLFGKISIIDILILVVLIGAVAGVGYKFNKSKTVTPFTKLDDIEITFFAEEVPDFAVKSMKKGDPVRDAIQNVTIGQVVDIKTDKSVSWAWDDKGQWVSSPKVGYMSLTLTVEAKGIYSDRGVFFNNAEFFEGILATYRVGNAAFYGRIAEFKKK